MLDHFAVLGSMLFRGHVRIYAPMRVAAQRGWGRVFVPADYFCG